MIKEPSYKGQDLSNKIKENESLFNKKVDDINFWDIAGNFFIGTSFSIQSSYTYLVDYKKNETEKRKRIEGVLKDVFENRNEKLTVKMIKKWANDLNGDIHIDVWRNKNDIVGDEYLPISYLLVKQVLSKLVEKFHLVKQQTNTHSPYAIAAWFSHAFTCIHPFSHNNGHMSRILANYILFSYGFPFPVPIIVKKSTYLKALRNADESINSLGGRDTSYLAYIYLESCNLIYKNYLTNLNLLNEFNLFPNIL